MQGPVAKMDGPVQVEPAHTGKVIALSIVGALGGFLFGYDSAVINGANQAVYHEFNITNTTYQGFIVAIALLGSAVGALVGGRIANTMGRQKVMLVAAVMFFISAVGQGFPFGPIDFMFWRVVGGFAIGLAAVVSPMYISEVAPAHLRGRMSSLFQFAIVIGIFATQLVNQMLLLAAGGATKVCESPGLSDCIPAPAPGMQPQVQANNEFWFGLQTWQWMFLFMVIPSVIYFMLASGLPESPRYLVMRGKYDEAKAVLEKVYVENIGPKLEVIKDSLSAEHKPSWSDVKGNTFGLQKIVWVGIILAVFQQFVGINAVFYYSNIVFQAVGFTTADAFKQSTIISAVNVVSTLIAIALIDRLGRKPLLMIGSLGMFLTLGTISALFITAPKATEGDVTASLTAGGSLGLGNPALSTSNGWIAVVALNLYVVFFAATWGPIVWVLLGEMFSNTIRAVAMSLGVAANWIANFIVSETFPTLVKISIGMAYGIFTVCAFLSIFFVWKFVTETKGASLEDMEQLEGISRPA